jgi:hypothetical protein
MNASRSARVAASRVVGRSVARSRSSVQWARSGRSRRKVSALMYVLLYTPGRGLTGWDWFWVVLAALLDIGHWGASASQRNEIPGRRASEA